MEGVLGEGTIEVMRLTVHGKGRHLIFCKRTDCKYFKFADHLRSLLHILLCFLF